MNAAATQRRRRRLWPVLALVAVLACLAGLTFAVFAGRVVVPAASTRIYPLKYEAEIAGVAERYDLDPYLVAAVARTESSFDPRAESRVGARGLMQLMPGTVDFVTGLDSYQGSDEPKLTDPEDSLELGACYLAYLLRRFDGDETAALAAYNAGPTPVGRWIEAGGGGSLKAADIGYPETQEYVKRVEHFRTLFERVHPDAF
jgi:soluble lytic murein transglycosylase